MGAYELTLGPFLIASWANAMLWTIEMKQALRFFVTYKHDGPLLRIMVAGLLLVDSFGSITVFANAYLVSPFPLRRLSGCTQSPETETSPLSSMPPV